MPRRSTLYYSLATFNLALVLVAAVVGVWLWGNLVLGAFFLVIGLAEEDFR